MCSSCHGTTTNAQSMNVLSLPIRNQRTPVHLSQCLSAFIAQEHLVGRDGLQCGQCQAQSSQRVAQTPGVQTRLAVARSHPDSVPVSPIQPHIASVLQPTGKLHQDVQFLSSTPLPGANKSRSAPLPVSVNAPKVVTEAVRQCLLRRLPQCLTIQVLRFNYEVSKRKVSKLRTPVTIPSKRLDLRKLTYDSTVGREDITVVSKSDVYSLYAVCLHLGGEDTNSGHYVAHCRAVNGTWYRLDDERVDTITDIENELKSEEVQENCYLLFYCKDHDSNS